MCWSDKLLRAEPDPSAILFAVSHTVDGCELTVFENGEACSVLLSPQLVELLVQLLTRQ